MSDVYFGDASYFIAVLNPRDQWHRAAVSVRLPPRCSLVTTPWIITEVANFLAAPPNRQRFVDWYADARRLVRAYDAHAGEAGELQVRRVKCGYSNGANLFARFPPESHPWYLPKPMKSLGR
jgi:hypothetical protein